MNCRVCDSRDLELAIDLGSQPWCNHFIRLEEAVRIRLMSDVPLGALLSGGVDSSIVVALMSRFSSGRVKTFSIGFSSQDFNEADYARMVAQRFDTEHHELFVEPAIEQTLDELTHSLEEPFGDSSIIPTYHVCRLARKYVTVSSRSAWRTRPRRYS